MTWECQKGHTYESVVASRLRNIDGCPVCYGRQVLQGFNDLATVSPQLAAEAFGWDPRTVTRGSGKKQKWQCQLGPVFASTVAERSLGNGCPFCSGRRVLAGFNDLVTTHPDLAAEAIGWDPRTVTAGSNKRQDWKCRLGHQWTSLVTQRVGGSGCPYCSGHKVLAGFNDLVTTHPDLAAEATGWDPTTKSKGSDFKLSWICNKGHNYKSTISNRVAGNGCPTCANFGFSPGREGWVYLVLNNELDLLQIGITNTPEQRLKQHQKSGFDQLLDLRGPMDGEFVRRTEISILKSLRKRDAVFARDAIDARFSGFTESWTRSSLPVTTIRQLLDLVEIDEIAL
jgi:tRNA(Arg) A34 adenosine deaminase TadA